MKRKHLLLFFLYVFVIFVNVPVTYAQNTTDLNLNDVLSALGPRSGQDLLWDIMLYLIFFLGVVNMLLIPDKQLFPAMLNFTVMGLAIVSKLLVGTGRTIEPTDFPVLVFNAGMFVLPLTIAGMVRSVKGKPSKAIGPAILMGLLGGGYFFLYWALEQRNYEPETALTLLRALW